jgi:hypothetical protein
MEKIIQRLVTQIEQLGGLDYSTTEDSITVQNNSNQGFLVTLWIDRDQTFIVNYGHFWHGHFDLFEEAEKCFIFGVTGRSRLVCTYRWRYLTKAVAEYYIDDQWQQVDVTGSCLGFLVWWLPRHVKQISNQRVGVSDRS